MEFFAVFSLTFFALFYCLLFIVTVYYNLLITDYLNMYFHFTYKRSLTGCGDMRVVVVMGPHVDTLCMAWSPVCTCMHLCR